MERCSTFKPDLADCVLEDRILAAVSQGVVPVVVTQSVAPIVLTTSGYSLINTATLFSAPFTLGGGPGANGANSGINMASGFYITGFGLSVMIIGNSSGYPGLGPGGQGSASSGTSANQSGFTNVGSGANEAGGAPIVSRNPSGQSLPLNPGSGFLYIKIC